MLNHKPILGLAACEEMKLIKLEINIIENRYDKK